MLRRFLARAARTVLGPKAATAIAAHPLVAWMRPRDPARSLALPTAGPYQTTLRFAERMFPVSGEASDPNFMLSATQGAYGGRATSNTYRTAICDGATCIDVGANIGLTALLALSVAPVKQLFLFEPDPMNFAHLRRNVGSFPNVMAVQSALGSQRSMVRFSAMGPYGHVMAPGETSDSVEVCVQALDDWAEEQRLSELHFIKIDVEGFERYVLAGARKTIARFRPVMLIEMNSFATILFGRTTPFDLLDELMSMFPFVCVVDRGTGLPQKLDTPLTRYHFVHFNLRNGFVDDLLCFFDESQLRPTTKP